MSIKLIVGLGNPGTEYEHTRHNAGFWFLDELARQWKAVWKHEKKYFGHTARVSRPEGEVWLLKPDTYMNLSGKAVAALAQFYKIRPEEILVAHDELDIPCGQIRFKLGGGNGGHNGLKDIQAKFGTPQRHPSPPRQPRLLPPAPRHRPPRRPQSGRRLCVEQAECRRPRPARQGNRKIAARPAADYGGRPRSRHPLPACEIAGRPSEKTVSDGLYFVRQGLDAPSGISCLHTAFDHNGAFKVNGVSA